MTESDRAQRDTADQATGRKTAETGAAAGKTVFIKTYGCQMNVYDGDRMADALSQAGYARIDSPEGADMVLLNTCHIREKAAEKVYSELGRLKALSEEKAREGGRLLIGVAGCVAQAEGQEMQKRQPLIDIVVGPQSYHRLPQLARAAEAGERVVDTDFPAEDKFDHLPKSERPLPPTAFMTVQEGCDKFCAFCVVPYTRGAEVSRPAAKLLDEARRLVARGVVEITLLGQNVNAYHGVGQDGAEWGLARLIRALAEIEGLERIRYTTSHPNDMDDALIAAHAEIPELMPYLHLPVQSGSDRVLKAMNRRHTAAEYLRLIDRIRAARPDIALSGDFIVGFPGETEAEFEATLSLAREVGYASAFSFKYSSRPGTPAADASEQLPEEVKSERLHRLQALLGETQAAFQQSCVGRELPILLEKPGRNTGQMIGRSPYLQSVHVDAPETLRGKIVSARIESALTNSLAGRISPQAA